MFSVAKLLIAALLAVTSPVLAAEMEPLTGGSPAKTSAAGTFCTEDKVWCAYITDDEEALFFQRFAEEEGHWQVVWDGRVPLAGQESEALADRVLWQHAIRISNRRVVFGVLDTHEAYYSGGGAWAEYLTLIHIDLDGDEPGLPILDVPVRSAVSIRACFSPDDAERRRGACHDEYSFSASLTLALQVGEEGALPDLVYTTEASSYPGPVSRNTDSLAAPPLSAGDLVEVRNDRCSFERTFVYDPAGGAYQVGTPLPDCSDYTRP